MAAFDEIPDVVAEKIADGKLPCDSDMDICEEVPSVSTNESINTVPKLSLSLPANEDFTMKLCSLSPQTPCSQFDSCVLEDVGQCAGIAGAALCRWDNFVGTRVVYTWATSTRRLAWLASPNVIGFVAHFTIVSEVLRNPQNEAKFFASPSSDVVLASFLFDACATETKCKFLSSNAMSTHSLSVILPHSELSGFLRFQAICLEWLGRTAVAFRLRLAKDVEQAYSWFRQSFIDFLKLVNSLQHASVPHAISLVNTSFYPGHAFNVSFLRRAISAHLYQCQQSVVIGASVSRINLMVATLSMLVTSSCQDRCRYAVESDRQVFSPELCVQGLVKTSSWYEQLSALSEVIYYSQYPTALIDVTEDEVMVLCPPYEYITQRQQFLSCQVRNVWSDKPVRKLRNSATLFQSFNTEESLVDRFLQQASNSRLSTQFEALTITSKFQIQLLPLTHGVREEFIHTFMALLQRKALAVIKFVATETEYGLRRRSSLPGKLREVFSLQLDGDLMAVVNTAERLKRGLLHIVCGPPQ